MAEMKKDLNDPEFMARFRAFQERKS